MIATKQLVEADEPWWRTLLRLLVLPLLFSAVILGAWRAGGSHAARLANAELTVALVGPLTSVAVVLGILKTGSDRALVLPTPVMLWLIFSADRAATAPWYALLVAELAALVLLFGCWQQKRKLAQVAAICCGAAIVWFQLSGALHLG